MVVAVYARCVVKERLRIPFYLCHVPAGFPSPADDYIERALDLNELCIRRPAATYLVRVDGDSMIEAGIHHGDILVVDRSVKPVHGDIVVASFQGEFTVKELQLRPSVKLLPRNPRYRPIDLGPSPELEIFGTVVGVVRVMHRG